MMHGPTDDFTLPDTLQARLRTQLAPLAPGGDPVEASFLADQPPGPQLVDLLALDASPPRLQIVRTEGLDPRVRLMIAARTGALSPSHAAALTDRGVVIDEVGIADTDLSWILELCWRRRMRPGGLALRRAFAAAQGQEPGASAARTGEDFLQRTPFGDTMRGCDWFLPIGWELRPFFVVCGDSAADFCLALALDRCYGDAAWFPRSFVHGDNDVAATARFTLALLIDGLRSVAEERPSVVISATLTNAEVREAAQALLPEAVGQDRVRVAEPAQLPLGWPW